MKWIAQFKEDWNKFNEEEQLDGYEYSAVKDDNVHGKASWGWGDDDKIILFGSGIGETHTENRRHALLIVQRFVNMLNEEGL